jgi:hypothetical protein
MSGWQPDQYEQRQPRWEEHQSAIPAHLLQRDQYSQPPQYRQPESGPHYQSPPRRQTGVYIAWACAGVAAVLAVAGWYTALKEHHSATTVTTTAQPDNEAGVRAAATDFYAFYSARQWDQAWSDLAPSVQAKVSEAIWTAVHNACPGESDGLAREIKSVTVDGSTAVVTETIAGALGKLGTASDAWTYTGSRWGFAMTASDVAIYQHSSVKADVIAAKKAGSCS